MEFDVTSDLGGRTALHLAIAHQHTRVVNVLLSHAGQLPGHTCIHVYVYVYMYIPSSVILAELPMDSSVGKSASQGAKCVYVTRLLELYMDMTSL